MLKPTDSPFWQAARPRPRPMCVLPNMLATAPDARDAETEQLIKERRQKALLMIEKMREGE